VSSYGRLRSAYRRQAKREGLAGVTFPGNPDYGPARIDTTATAGEEVCAAQAAPHPRVASTTRSELSGHWRAAPVRVSTRKEEW